MDPVALGPNQFPHFYRGGPAIASFRGLAQAESDTPEDWVAATTSRAGQGELGLSRLPDGRLLRDAVAADPQAWLGAEHRAAFGDVTDLLVKLLDTGQRLLVHVHPDRDFARAHLGCAHGKTEAWIVLEASVAEPVVHLGFRADVDAGTVAGWVREQDTAALLSALNTVPVSVGDGVLVPAGVPHAIGKGILIAELQEPTDFSLLLEWRGFDIDGERDGHLGLGFDLALQAVDRAGWDAARLARLRARAVGDYPRQPLLPAEAAPFFRAEQIGPGAGCEPSFAVLVVTAGSGEVRSEHGRPLPVRRGDTVLVPHAAGRTDLTGDARAVRCLPPDPAAGSPSRPQV